MNKTILFSILSVVAIAAGVMKVAAPIPAQEAFSTASEAQDRSIPAELADMEPAMESPPLKELSVPISSKENEASSQTTGLEQHPLVTKMLCKLKAFGNFQKDQLDNAYSLINECVYQKITDERQLAYVLSTAIGESNIRPIKEYRGA